MGAAPGTLTFYLNPKNTLTTFGGEFLVEESVDNVTFTTIQAVGTELGATTSGTAYSKTPNAASRYIRFRYSDVKGTTHIMQLDKVSILAITGPEIDIKAGETNQLTGSTYNFGNQNLNTTSNPVTFTIQNTGVSDLNLTGVPIVSLSGTDASLFTMSQATTASVVAAGGSTTYTVSFSATSAGAKTALLTIASNDADEGSYTINLTGTGKDMPPAISAINPTEGKVGDEVVITGVDLQNVTGVTFNGTPAPTFTIVNNSEIRATVPAGATTGPIAVTAPGGNASSAIFTVHQLPTITGFTPGSGVTGTVVTITGTNFTQASIVRFNGKDAVTVWVNVGELQATVPATATDGSITVTNQGGTATSASPFDVLAPTISAISPTFGGEGMEVTITGTNFTAEATLAFNGTAVVTKTYVSATQYKAIVPAGATTGAITLTTNGGTASSAIFTVHPKPTITGFTPGSGQAGAVITITGTYFTENSVVRFNGVEAVSMVVSGLELQAVVPDVATDGPISVTTEGGMAISGAAFDRLYPAPTISSFSPASGPVGTEVTINGTNFTAEATIAFNGTAAVTKTFVDATQYKAIVPAGTTDGAIAITANELTATSATSYIVTGTGTYTWNAAGGTGNWTVASNWSPARTTPNVADVLIFDGAVTPTVAATLDFATAQTIGQLEFKNTVAATFTVDADKTLTLDGGVTGTDFLIHAGSALTVTNSVLDTELNINLTTGETGSVAGALQLQGAATAAHRITAADASGLIFASGSTFTTNTNFSGSPFGTTNLNSVNFANGSVYNHQAGGSPFGAVSPDAVVVFGTGSTYKQRVNTEPDLLSRTYGHLEIDHVDFNQSPAGTGTLVVTDLVLTNATAFNLNVVGNISINGNILVNAGTLAFNPLTTSNYNIVGSGIKNLSGAGIFTLGGNANFNITANNTLALLKDIEGTGTVVLSGTAATANTNGFALGPNTSIRTGVGLTINAGSTVVYNGTGAQTISELPYASLTIEGNRGSAAVTLPTTNTTFKISEVFTPSATNVVYNGTSTIEFNGSAAQTVPVFGYNNLVISGTGIKTLAGNSNVNGQLLLDNATFQTGSNVVDLGATGTITESGSGYVLGQVQVNREVTGAAQGFGGIGVTMTPAGGSVNPGATTILRDTRTAVPARPVTGGKGSITRVYQITNTTPDINVAMTLSYAERELVNGISEASGLRMYRLNAEGFWEEKETSTLDPVANTVSLTGVTAFSPWTIAEPASVLPVELTAFTATRRHEVVELVWSTAMEDNNQGFEVEVSADARYYEKVGFVASKDPNSRVAVTYTFTDERTLVQGTRYYRLKQIDLDGKASYYGPKAVNFEAALTAAKVYPNPFNDVFTVRYISEANQQLTLTVVDALGKKVYEQQVSVTRGMNYLQVPVGNHHPKGVYLLHISGAHATQHFKMLKK